MATVEYEWDDFVGGFTILSTNTELPGDQTNPVLTALRDGSGFFTAWDQPGFELVDGLIVGAGNRPLTPEFLLNQTTTDDQFNPSLATLNNGNVVVTYTDLSGGDADIRARLFTSAGEPIGQELDPIDTNKADTDSDVAALADGGFVVTWTRDFNGAGDNDLHAQLYNSDGTKRGNVITVDSNASLNTNSSQVTGLANGNLVVAWEQEPAAGGDTEVAFRIFDSTGSPVGDSIAGSTLIDTGGSINEDIHIVALQDGGFAVAYADNGWNGGANGTDITFKIYDSDGTPRTNFFSQVNGPGNNGQTDGDQTNPTLAVLSNGYIVVGWMNGTEITYQAYDPDGNPIGKNNVGIGGTVEGAIAGLSDGLLAAVVQCFSAGDGAGNSILTANSALIRTTTGDSANETLKGDSLRDRIFGLGGKDTLLGGAGDDRLDGGNGNDKLNGGSAFDVAVYTAATAGVRVDLALTGAQNTGGAGTDTLISIESLEGSNFNDTLKGNAKANSIQGRGGDDVIDGGGGNDTINGGGSNDTASYASAVSGVKVSLSLDGIAQNTGGAGIDTLFVFNRLIGSAFNDVLTGNVGQNTLKSAAGSDRLIGGDGNDVLDGGAGKDILDGGAALDWATYATAGSGVTVNLGLATFQNTGGGGIDKLTDVENITGSKFSDHLTGSSAGNSIVGGGGSDTLNGGGGADTLEGGAGNDVMNGGAGIDLATYALAGSAVKVSLAIAGAQNTLGAGTDSLSNVENLTGSKFNDTLTGNSGDNILLGGAGHDTLNGGGGADTLEGGNGNDVMNGGAGIDLVTYGLAGSAVTVSLLVAGAQNTLGYGTDKLSGIENLIGSDFGDTLTGNGGANLLAGGNGNDTLSGGGGDDTLVGGFGTDQLTGGAGSDTFQYFLLFESSGSLLFSDLITDFAAGDKIDLSAIDADSGTAGNQAFVIDNTPDGAGDLSFVFEAGDNRTLVSLFVDNDANPDAVIILSGDHSTLTAADFIL
jgi:Ca2+-binding RTX toxin-like protein